MKKNQKIKIKTSKVKGTPVFKPKGENNGSK